MTHMSGLALFDYLTGRTDLTTQETDHLQDCSDCREEAVRLRRIIATYGDIEKARRSVASGQEEEEKPLSAGEPPDTYAA